MTSLFDGLFNRNKMFNIYYLLIDIFRLNWPVFLSKKKDLRILTIKLKQKTRIICLKVERFLWNSRAKNNQYITLHNFSL